MRQTQRSRRDRHSILSQTLGYHAQPDVRGGVPLFVWLEGLPHGTKGGDAGSCVGGGYVSSVAGFRCLARGWRLTQVRLLSSACVVHPHASVAVNARLFACLHVRCTPSRVEQRAGVSKRRVWEAPWASLCLALTARRFHGYALCVACYALRSRVACYVRVACYAVMCHVGLRGVTWGYVGSRGVTCLVRALLVAAREGGGALVRPHAVL